MGCKGSRIVTSVEVAHTTAQADARFSLWGARFEGNSEAAAKASYTEHNQRPEAETDMQLVRASLCRTNNERLGLRCVVYPNTQEAVITEVQPDGVVTKWNEGNPEAALCVGDVLVDVNKKTSLQEMMNELTINGLIEVLVRRASDEFSGKACRGCAQKTRFYTLPQIVRAADIDFIGDGCAICLESVEPDDGLVKLDCGHGFHMGCLTEYLMQGKRRVCPLCIRELH